MPNIAYITNLFPSAVEPYVMQEIAELRGRGVAVTPFSSQRPKSVHSSLQPWVSETVYLRPLRISTVIRVIWLCMASIPVVFGLIHDALVNEHQSLLRRLKALVHTFFGAYLAILLKDAKVKHIHVHHGYFSCWVALSASRLCGITYSVTLHGSDLLINKAFIATKLEHCEFCITVSEFNRQHILDNHPKLHRRRLVVQRMGVETRVTSSRTNFSPRIRAALPAQSISTAEWPTRRPLYKGPLLLLSVGRLHSIKNHTFLVEVCARMKQRGQPFACMIAGEGEERERLQTQIQLLRLEHEILLLGHLSPQQLDAYYTNANLVVLTSHSEGLPLTLMEAMARRKLVLAPAITGIPELVVDGETGFLYKPGCMDSFISKTEEIRRSPPDRLETIRNAARVLIVDKYNRETNLAAFADVLLQRIGTPKEVNPHENFVLQQI